MTTLISFLGKQNKGYRTARYHFANGDESKSCAAQTSTPDSYDKNPCPT